MFYSFLILIWFFVVIFVILSTCLLGWPIKECSWMYDVQMYNSCFLERQSCTMLNCFFSSSMLHAKNMNQSSNEYMKFFYVFGKAKKWNYDPQVWSCGKDLWFLLSDPRWRLFGVFVFCFLFVGWGVVLGLGLQKQKNGISRNKKFILLDWGVRKLILHLYTTLLILSIFLKTKRILC